MNALSQDIPNLSQIQLGYLIETCVEHSGLTLAEFGVQSEVR